MRTAAVLAAVLFALAACAPPQVAVPSPSPTASAVPAVTAAASPAADLDLAREVRALFAERRSAVEARDRARFDATYDTTLPSFARCQGESFERALLTGATPPPAFVHVEAYGSYIRAYVERGGSVRRDYLDRVDGGGLRLTEPAPNEIGASRVRTVDDLRIEYWEIDEEIIDVIAETAAKARDLAVAHLPGPMTKLFTVRVFPIRSLLGQSCNVAGTADVANASAPVISVFDVPLGLSLGPSAALDHLLRHEALHWVQGQALGTRMLNLQWWLVEGWPDFVVAYDRSSLLRRSCAQGWPAMDQLMNVRTALSDPIPSEEVARSYAAAAAMVQYLVDQHGADTYWKLARALSASAVADLAYQSVLGIDASTFYTRWAGWARERFC